MTTCWKTKFLKIRDGAHIQPSNKDVAVSFDKAEADLYIAEVKAKLAENKKSSVVIGPRLTGETDQRIARALEEADHVFYEAHNHFERARLDQSFRGEHHEPSH